MTDYENDLYLWEPEAPPTSEIVALERQLRPLAWTPTELAVAPAPVMARAPAAKPTRRPDWRTMTPALAGLAAAAAVLTTIVWLRTQPQPITPTTQPTVFDRNFDPSIEPASPPNPDLRDPFADDTRTPPSFPAPNVQPTSDGDLVDPFRDPKKSPTKGPARPAISPDLKDPFASTPAESDVKNPWASDERDQRPAVPSKKPSKLTDPFGDEPIVPESSPDLRDPFSSPR
jgi:hypothetical protein